MTEAPYYSLELAPDPGIRIRTMYSLYNRTVQWLTYPRHYERRYNEPYTGEPKNLGFYGKLIDGWPEYVTFGQIPATQSRSRMGVEMLAHIRCDLSGPGEIYEDMLLARKDKDKAAISTLCDILNDYKVQIIKKPKLQFDQDTFVSMLAQ